MVTAVHDHINYTSCIYVLVLCTFCRLRSSIKIHLCPAHLSCLLVFAPLLPTPCKCVLTGFFKLIRQSSILPCCNRRRADILCLMDPAKKTFCLADTKCQQIASKRRSVPQAACADIHYPDFGTPCCTKTTIICACCCVQMACQTWSDGKVSCSQWVGACCDKTAESADIMASLRSQYILGHLDCICMFFGYICSMSCLFATQL